MSDLLASIPLSSKRKHVCRICLETGSLGTLCSPCECKGSLQYVHTKCLRHWVHSLRKTSRLPLQCSCCLKPMMMPLDSTGVLLLHRYASVWSVLILVSVIWAAGHVWGTVDVWKRAQGFSLPVVMNGWLEKVAVLVSWHADKIVNGSVVLVLSVGMLPSPILKVIVVLIALFCLIHLL